MRGSEGLRGCAGLSGHAPGCRARQPLPATPARRARWPRLAAPGLAGLRRPFPATPRLAGLRRPYRPHPGPQRCAVPSRPHPGPQRCSVPSRPHPGPRNCAGPSRPHPGPRPRRPSRPHPGPQPCQELKCRFTIIALVPASVAGVQANLESVMQRSDFAAVSAVAGSYPHPDPQRPTDRILARLAGMPALGRRGRPSTAREIGP